jgi:hypothetical protein
LELEALYIPVIYNFLNINTFFLDSCEKTKCTGFHDIFITEGRYI